MTNVKRGPLEETTQGQGQGLRVENFSGKNKISKMFLRIQGPQGIEHKKAQPAHWRAGVHPTPGNFQKNLATHKHLVEIWKGEQIDFFFRKIRTETFGSETIWKGGEQIDFFFRCKIKRLHPDKVQPKDKATGQQ